MKSRSGKSSLKSLYAIGMGLMLSASAATAQNDWEGFYQPLGQPAAARGGILHFADNSSIAVGEAIGINGNSDIYVTHQGGADCGNFDWQYTYHIGGNDVGRKIRSTSDGGYIIVGTTQNTGTGCTANDIFLLKITSNGTVSWARTYGGSGAEEGLDVQVLSNGDFIVAGSITSAGAGARDGYLLRTTSAGVPIWGQTYGSTGDEIFQSVEVAANGELIVSGSNSSNSVGGADILLARINAATAFPVFFYNYGTSANEIAWRAIELSNGNIAIAGNTRGFGGNSEGAILLTSSTGTFLGGHYYGGGASSGWDEFLDIMQLPGGGDLMVTGLFFNPSGGFGGYDVYVGRVNAGTLAPVSQLLFGSTGNDQGWAITKSGYGNANAWMVAGLSPGYGTSTTDKLYIISRPNMNLRSCFNSIPTITHGSASFSRVSPTVLRSSYAPNCFVTPTRRGDAGFQSGCGNCGFSKPGTAEPEGISEYRGPDFSSHISPGVVDSTNLLVSSVDDNAGASAALYPNPVRSGRSFTIALPATAGSIGIIVTDMAGKVVYTGTASGSEVSIPTSDWAAGAYAVRLSRDGKTSTRQIVVTE